MRPTLLWILLALSVALNLFAIGGYAYTRYTMQSWHMAPGDRANMVGDRLGLNADQRATLASILGDLRNEMMRARKERMEWRQSLITRLSDPNFNVGALEAEIRHSAEQRVQFQLESTTRMRALILTLTEDQRQKLQHLLASVPAGRPMCP
jgi:uncharacterized membrane protein